MAPAEQALAGAVAHGLRVEQPSPGVQLLTLARPAVRNALSYALSLELRQVLVDIAGEPSVRAVVVTGADGAFSAGADFDMLAAGDLSQDEVETAYRTAFSAVEVMATMPQPVIAAIDGPACGGALGIALGCDIRIAAPSARFSAPFIRMGLIPDYGLTFTLPAVVGYDRALELCLSGRLIDAGEALRIGLVTSVEPDPLAAALALAEAVAERDADAVRLTKDLLRTAPRASLDARLRLEAELQAARTRGPAFLERLAAWRATSRGAG